MTPTPDIEKLRTMAAEHGLVLKTSTGEDWTGSGDVIIIDPALETESAFDAETFINAAEMGTIRADNKRRLLREMLVADTPRQKTPKPQQAEPAAPLRQRQRLLAKKQRRGRK